MAVLKKGGITINNIVSKVSEITAKDLADYIRLSDATMEENITLNTLLNVAKSYIASYTGHTTEELDDYKEFVFAVFILVQDMWDNRSLYVESDNVNKVVETILGMHSVNLL